MFTLDWFYQLHFYIIALGVVSLMAALYIIKFKKDKPWRIMRHRLLAVLGASLILIGVIIMFFGKQSTGLSHFIVPHAFGGVFVLVMMITAIVLATIGMKGNKKMLQAHRWVGRITGILVLLVAVVGFTVLLSYI